jgi:hypothetical protein
MSDPHYYTGADDRDFDPEVGTCLHCGAGPAEDCAIGCRCESCEADRDADAERQANRGAA